VGVGDGDGCGGGDSVNGVSAFSGSSFGVGAGDSLEGVFGFSGSSSGETVGLAVAVAVADAIDPGSDHPPTLSPLSKFACSLVFCCSLITGPSNFPRTILPV
jgi:hypothetical protein